MTWDYFIYFSVLSTILWAIGGYYAWREKRNVLVYTFTLLGILVFFSFILGMWISLERPPMRTMGETRLWYSFFLPIAGIITYSRWRYRWILLFSTILSFVFICINIFKPEIHNKTLMPALQSVWFAPHVISYMFSYAMLGAAAVMSAYLLFFKKKAIEAKEMELTDNMAYVGLSFLSFGMLIGAIWAKEAWGHYWSWDPKETWAAITWFAYLIYIHFRLGSPRKERIALSLLIVAFVLLQICWWGLNFIPAAQGSSIHIYNSVS
ncbi:MAG: cytochrome c biogenesis protein CcsA [Bacteroides sp.]|nr:cytochrome c biogenesis protein CcsA [Bacteroides sp.]